MDLPDFFFHLSNQLIFWGRRGIEVRVLSLSQIGILFIFFGCAKLVLRYCSNFFSCMVLPVK